MYNLDKKKLFLLDMDGTLYLGNSLFPETLPFLENIKMPKILHCIVS